ncbi:MAG: hypothetical protein VXV85_02615 [Candidatus Thermoplasmatota archaeon]|nr:hypothetical protein [Candidatus Thermoplasmatota archaeon]
MVYLSRLTSFDASQACFDGPDSKATPLNYESQVNAWLSGRHI